MKNPLHKRIPREIRKDWRKNLLIFLFVTLLTGIVSGISIASLSMTYTMEAAAIDLHQEDGHFILDKKASRTELLAMESGQKADLERYFQDQARQEFDEKFPAAFQEEFDKNFDAQFEKTLRQQYADLPADMMETALKQAKGSKAYQQAYDQAWKEAYQKAYDQGLAEVDDQVQVEVEKVQARFEDENFKPVSLTIVPDFYKEAAEKITGNEDAITIRVYTNQDQINQPSVFEGHLPQNETEIAIDRAHAQSCKLSVGDQIEVGGKSFTISALIARPDYFGLFQKNTDTVHNTLIFDIGLVTMDGFEQIQAPTIWNYAFDYVNAPKNENEENEMAGDAAISLASQAIVHDNELTDFLPVYLNQAVQYAANDIRHDGFAMVLVYDILIALLAFIFALNTTSVLERESRTIGTLKASGFTNGELIFHYLLPPVVVVACGAVAGNLLAYTVLKDYCAGIYYGSYSLPVLQTVFNGDAFWQTTVVPLVLVIGINLVILMIWFAKTPQQLLRKQFKTSKRHKAMRLPNWSFFNRFRLRIILQNLPNFGVLFVGILFSALLMSLALGFDDTIRYYQENITDSMLAKYQYVLNDAKDEDDHMITIENKEAEPFLMQTLKMADSPIDEEISFYGLPADTHYLPDGMLENLADNKVVVSMIFRDKYDLKPGSVLRLSGQFDQDVQEYVVADLVDLGPVLDVFTTEDNYRHTYEIDADVFTGFLSNEELADLDEDQIAAVITEKDILKTAEEMDHACGTIMDLLKYLVLILFVFLIYLLTKIILEKNERSISLIKILGYDDLEAAKLYLVATFFVVVVCAAICAWIAPPMIISLWNLIFRNYNGWMTYIVSAQSRLKLFVSIVLCDVVVALVDYSRIRKIPMEKVLKDTE